MSDHKFTEKNPRLFYDPKDFSFLQPLTQNSETIKSELIDLLKNQVEDQWLRTFPDYVESGTKKAWKVFSFIFFSMKIPANAKLCPETAKLIYSIPEIISCDFSSLEGNTHILPHKGYSRMVLRCHLPLIIPSEELCGIRVGTETHHWKEGELLIFDDSFEHEAWNKSSEKRVVLMFDIPNPLWGYSAYEISKYKIDHLEDPFLLSLATKKQWEEGFQNGTVPLNSFGNK